MTVSVAESGPDTAGINVTTREQDALAASVDPQVLLENTKSAVFPVMVKPVAEDPELFVSVKVTGGLEDPTLIDPKFSVDGKRVTLPVLA